MPTNQDVTEKVIVLHPSPGSKSERPGEQLVEAMGSWAAGFGLSPGEKSEQEYLFALSCQYQVEHYEDSYNLMGQLTTYDGQRLMFFFFFGTYILAHTCGKCNVEAVFTH